MTSEEREACVLLIAEYPAIIHEKQDSIKAAKAEAPFEE